MKAPELLDLAIDWLKSEYPDSVIVPELSVADWGGALIDVAAITDDEIVGIEIKGDGDSPSRLDLQGLRYGQVARKMWLLVSPEGTLSERCMKKRPKSWGVLDASAGKIAPRLRFTEIPWEPRDSRSFCPWSMCGTLWRDELYDLAVRASFTVPKRARVEELTDLICNGLTVPKLHDAMIYQLRMRDWGHKRVIDLRAPDESCPFPNRKSPNRPIQGDLLRGV